MANPPAPLLTYAPLSFYPHMKPADVLIWERYLAAFPNAYETVQYDFLVGSPPLFDTTVNPETGGSDEALYKRKIDVVGWRKGAIDVIELKPNAGPSALGQVLGYLHLYVRDEHPTEPVHAVLITDRINTDMEELATKMGVRLIVI